MTVLALEQVTKHYPRGDSAAVDCLSLEVGSGEVFALLGESGSGKTTTLRLIAGFEVPSSGKVRILSRTVASPSRFVPPEKRGVRMVFQQNALFPHLTVSGNLAFPVQHWGRRERRQALRQVLAIVNLEDFASRYPHELSGGQRQRVELARALISEPALLLLDEPFSNLDVSLRAQLRGEIAEILHRTNTTSILVTHDVEDAFTVSDRVAVLKEGRLQQVGSPRNVYLHPANRYVAGFFGTVNLIPGHQHADSVVTPFGTVRLKRQGPMDATPVLLCIRPECFAIHEDNSFSLRGRVEKTTFLGRFQEVRLRPEDYDGTKTAPTLTAHLPADVTVQPGDTLTLRPKPGTIDRVQWTD